LSYISIALFYKSYILSDKFIQRVERYNRQFFNQSAFVTFVKYSATRESLRQRVTLDRYARVFADEFGEKPFFKLQYMKRNTTNILTSRDFPEELEPGSNLPDWYDSAEYLESNSGLKRIFVNIFARPVEHDDRMFIRTASNVYYFTINTYEDEDIIIKLGIFLPMSAKVSNILFKQYGIAFEQNEGVPTEDVSFLNSSFHLRDLESGESDGSATFRYYRSLTQILFSASTGNHAINYFISGLRDLVFSLIIIFLVLMSILGIIARNINRGIRLSLQKIIIGMRIIGEGNLDYKIDISSRDEYHRLANSINDMTEDIKHYMEERVETERLKAEVNTAYAIQNSILPSSNPAVNGIEIASYIKSAEEVGGDFYDFHMIDKNRLGFVIGDVSGHGVSAGMLMAMAKSCFYNQNEHSSDVVKMMESMNNMVSDTVKKRLLMTFMYAIIDTKTKKMYYSNAGHHYPYIFRSSDSTLEALEYPSYPLGVRKNSKFKKMKTDLMKDDYLIFYSDGIIEQLNDIGELFGFERMEQLITSSSIKTAEELKELILNNLNEFTKDNTQVDDITLIIIKVL
ncbi:MAG: SpoIIE family protein phosphatase, partial [Acidobacteria bacterium]|nr:SpoIIE family protein phosphatase [Acidobacteriota bacterium]